MKVGKKYLLSTSVNLFFVDCSHCRCLPGTFCDGEDRLFSARYLSEESRKQHPQLFPGSTLFNIQATLQTSERRGLAHLGTQLLNQNICLVSCSRAHSQKLPRAFVIHFSQPHFSSCSRDVNLHCPFMHETANICPSFNTLWP